MDKRLILILSLALVLCPSIGWYLSNDSFHRDTIFPVVSSAPPPPLLLTGTEVNTFIVEMHKREPVIITLGGPTLSQLPLSQGGLAPGYSDLDAFVDANSDWMMNTYCYPEGPVIGFGYDLDGYLDLTLWNGPPPPKNAYSVETLYAALGERARSMGIEDIPVKVKILTSPPILILHGE